MQKLTDDTKFNVHGMLANFENFFKFNKILKLLKNC